MTRSRYLLLGHRANARKLAEAVTMGARMPGAEGRLRRVQELEPRRKSIRGQGTSGTRHHEPGLGS